MAINNYTGLQGSGKSYEVVSTVILDAVLSGRRVVTNIDGINPEAIYDYLVEKRKGVREDLGTIISVKNEDVTLGDFFPDEEKPGVVSIVHPGDLVCIDEVWRFWGTDVKLDHNAMQFFRMHRHYTNPATGIACDIALMIQDTSSLHRKIREVVEMTTRTVKLKSIGMPTSYRIELYEGSKISKVCHIDTFVKKYNKDIFPLYKSYAAGTGKEKPMDKRQNIFNNKKIFFFAGFVLVMCIFAGYKAYKFFKPDPKPVLALSTSTAITPGGTAPPGAPGSTPVAAAVSEWRITGRYVAHGELYFIVQNNAGRIRYEPNTNFVVKGPVITGLVDGQPVNLYAGGNAGTSSLLDTKK